MSSTGRKETLSDVLTYLGTITYEGFGQIVHAVSSNPETRDRNVVLVLVTAGGNPHAAFRIVRFLQSSYRTVTAFVPGLCKSAGTLLCIGANEISITETGELGPLDVQVQKPSELIGYSSGLAIPQSLAFLEASLSIRHPQFGAPNSNRRSRFGSRKGSRDCDSNHGRPLPAHLPTDRSASYRRNHSRAGDSRGLREETPTGNTCGRTRETRIGLLVPRVCHRSL